jgi:hypothetical protein
MADLEFGYGMIKIPGSDPEKWILVPTDLNLEVARVFKNKQPELTEDESVLLAYVFLEEEICSDLFYNKRMNRDSFIGTEPFNFDEEKNPVSINEPAFSEWIDRLISYGKHLFDIPGDFTDNNGKLTIEIKKK